MYSSKSYRFTFEKDGSLDEAKINGQDLSEEDKKVMDDYFKKKEELLKELEKHYDDMNNEMDKIQKYLDKVDMEYVDKMKALKETTNIKAVFEKYPEKKVLSSPVRSVMLFNPFKHDWWYRW